MAASSIIQPSINRIGAGKDASYGILKIAIGGGQTIDLDVLVTATINVVLVAAVVHFLMVMPNNRIRTGIRRKPPRISRSGC